MLMIVIIKNNQIIPARTANQTVLGWAKQNILSAI